MAATRTFRVLPGFNLTLGYTLAYLSLMGLFLSFAVKFVAALPKTQTGKIQRFKLKAEA